MTVRVRFAPSPTGPLHIGGVRTALYNYLFAKKHGGDFILRIEDTDQGRFVEGAEEYIVESLKWLNICPNEGIGFGDGLFGPYHQSDRKSIYKEYVDKLIVAGKAYYAFDNTDDLEAMRTRLMAEGKDAKYDATTRYQMKNSFTISKEEVSELISGESSYVVRLKLDADEEVVFYDEIRGRVVFNTNQLDDKVLFKSDGMPTYHLANVVDDYLMKITHVIRGEEWLSSAPLHVLLYKNLGWEDKMPKFAHLPLLLKPEGNGKLSKRDGDRLGFPVFPLQWKDPKTNEVSSGYRESGYLSEAVVNLLAFLGWNPGTTQEIFSIDELIAAFSLEKVNKAGAKFDQNKAKWFNQQYIKVEKPELLAQSLKNGLEQIGISNERGNEYLVKVCSLVREKVSFTSELATYSKYFFVDPELYDETVIKKRWNEKIPQLLNDMINAFSTIVDFKKEQLEIAYNEALSKNDILAKDFLQLFRVCLSGVSAGPALFDMAEIFGKELTLHRLKLALNKIKI